MRQLGAAVIGLGVGQQHVLGFQRHPACQVVALCDLSEDKLAEAKSSCPGARTTNRWEDLLQDQDVDAISIASFDDVHYEQTLAALNAGKHVFVEKPLCQSSMDQLRSLKSMLVKRHSLHLASNLVLRAAPLYCWLRAQILDGAFGEIYAIDGDYLYGRVHKITEGWRKDIDDYSVMHGGGIHLIDLMLWLTGQKPTSVTAVGNRLCTRGTRFRYNDFVAATFRFGSGLIGRITANFGCVHRHQHVLRVFGTKATFIYDDRGPRWHTSRHPAAPSTPVTLSALPRSKGDLIPPFVEKVFQAADPATAAQQEFDTMSVCLGADRAQATNTSWEIEYV